MNDLKFMSLTSARKQGDSYTYSERLSVGTSNPIVIPAAVFFASAHLVTVSDEGFSADIQVSNSTLEKIEAGEGAWVSLGKDKEICATMIMELPRCQAVRVVVTKGDLLIEIYAS